MSVLGITSGLNIGYQKYIGQPNCILDFKNQGYIRECIKKSEFMSDSKHIYTIMS